MADAESLLGRAPDIVLELLVEELSVPAAKGDGRSVWALVQVRFEQERRRRGDASGVREPRRPAPRSGSGSEALLASSTRRRTEPLEIVRAETGIPGRPEMADDAVPVGHEAARPARGAAGRRRPV